jgi:hypothetical protein
MWWRAPHNPTAYDDDLEDQPGQGWFYQWALGVALPLVILFFGVRVTARQQALVGREMPVQLTGYDAIALGIAGISLAVFLHCHYFWGNIYNQAGLAVLGKIIAACGFIAGLFTLIVRVGLLNI